MEIRPRIIAIILIICLFTTPFSTIGYSFERKSNDNRYLNDGPKLLENQPLVDITAERDPPDISPVIMERILLYDSFEHRDAAITKLAEDKISRVFKYIPAISTNPIAPNVIPTLGLVSDTKNNKITKLSRIDQIYDLENEVDTGLTLEQTAQMIGIEKLRSDHNLFGNGISIAILDSGVNNELASFSDRINLHVVEGLKDKGETDQDGHGSHVAGIAAGDGDYFVDDEWKMTDSPGMAPAATIESIRVLDEDGNGENEWLLDGIEIAINNSVDIISMSLSTPIYKGIDDPLHEMVKRATQEGIIIVAAAGNRGPLGSAIGIPAAFPEVISVGATIYESDINEVWYASGVGPGINGFPGVDLVAPGAGIISINYLNGEPSLLSGTSMAAPHVSGGIALLKEAFPSATINEIREALIGSAQLTVDPVSGLYNQVEAQGTGFARFDLAYNILEETIINNPENHLEMSPNPNFVQDWNYVYQSSILNNTKTLPFFMYSSRNLTIQPNIDTEFTNGVDFAFMNTINITEGITQIDINITVIQERITVNSGRIYFTDNSTGQILPNANITYYSTTTFSQSKVLFDISHDEDTESGYYGNHGPNGQFSQFRRLLEREGHIVHENQAIELSLDYLLNYDMLVIANPDRDFTSAEINAIIEFNQIEGRSLLLLIGGGLLTKEGIPSFSRYNGEDINTLLEGSGISVTMDGEENYALNPCEFDLLVYEDQLSTCPQTAQTSNRQDILPKLTDFPNFGPSLDYSSNDTNTEKTNKLAYQDNDAVIMSAELSSGGRTMVFSSSLIFDNNGLLYDYSAGESAISNREMLRRTIDWLIEPRSVKMNYKINNDAAVYTNELLMHENTKISFSPVDKDGNPILLNEPVEVSYYLSDYESGYFEYNILEFIRNSQTNTYEVVITFERHIKLELFVHVKAENSIPSNGHIILDFGLKYFEDQGDMKNLSRYLFLAILLSWGGWMLNEGGRLKKSKQEKINL